MQLGELRDYAERRSEREILRLINQDENRAWKLLAIRAGYIRLGLVRKY